MPLIAVELGTSSTAVTGTMSLYLLAAGAGFAVWGPAAGVTSLPNQEVVSLICNALALSLSSFADSRYSLASRPYWGAC